jgi:hypothetical protein
MRWQEFGRSINIEDRRDPRTIGHDYPQQSDSPGYSWLDVIRAHFGLGSHTSGEQASAPQHRPGESNPDESSAAKHIIGFTSDIYNSVHDHAGRPGT